MPDVRKANTARHDETHLRLGNGLLRPASPIAAVRALNSQGSAAWYYRQIIRLSEDREPDTHLSFRQALRRHFVDEYRLGIARRRQVRLVD